MPGFLPAGDTLVTWRGSRRERDRARGASQPLGARRKAEARPVAAREMARADEAAGDRHVEHRHRGLAQERPRALEPDAQVVRADGRAEMDLEQALELARREPRHRSERPPRGGLLDARLHMLED